MEIASRPAVRIICLDATARVLLLRWQDPFDGHLLWEPPGGGIEPGESPIAAARRELMEETGLDPDAIVGSSIAVERNTVWNGRRFVGSEAFFLARYGDEAPELTRAGLLVDEQQNLRGHAWLSRGDLTAVTDPLEPPMLAAVVAKLDPHGPWRDHLGRP